LKQGLRAGKIPETKAQYYRYTTLLGDRFLLKLITLLPKKQDTIKVGVGLWIDF
jgi:hypothetical protein